jgi:hypothetical protein
MSNDPKSSSLNDTDSIAYCRANMMEELRLTFKCSLDDGGINDNRCSRCDDPVKFVIDPECRFTYDECFSHLKHHRTFQAHEHDGEFFLAWCEDCLFHTEGREELWPNPRWCTEVERRSLTANREAWSEIIRKQKVESRWETVAEEFHRRVRAVRLVKQIQRSFKERFYAPKGAFASNIGAPRFYQHTISKSASSAKRPRRA